MFRTVSLDLLDRVRVASPCSVSWDQMRPVEEGDRVRHCDQCGLNVHNLSGMDRAAATALFTPHLESGQHLCIRMFVRADGTVLTRDCPVGLRAARLRLVRAITRVAAVFAFLASGAVLARWRDRFAQAPGLSRVQPFATLCEWIRPVPVRGQAVMGRVAPIGVCGNGR